MEDLTGKQLGPYQVTASLGEGGMAAVYKAYQPSMDRYVALKILPRHFASDPNFIARFEQEAKVLAKLQHPHILPVFDYGAADGYTYIVMPFVASGTLTERLTSQPLPLAQIGTILHQIGDALDYAHSRGLIHRDVKPSNVLIDERGNCLLTDFGLAKILEGSTKLTTTGGIMGTPAYMSPEQGLGQKLDRHSDIYSLGVILYEMATGRAPYHAETPMAIVVKHINDPLPPPRTLNPALPEALERVILKALAKNPADRFDTAAEMVTALQAAVSQTVLAHPAPPAAAAFPQPPAATLPAAPALAAAVPPPDTAPVEKPTRAARPARAASLRPLWQLALLAALGWDAGILVSLPFAKAPVLAGLIIGAVGGLSLGSMWRRLEPNLPRRRVWTLAGMWAVAGALAAATLQGGLLALVFLALGGLGTGFIMRRADRRMSWKQIGLMALGWLMSWTVGGIVVAIFTRGGSQTIAAAAVVIGLTLAAAASNGFTLWQWKRAQARLPLTPEEQPRRRAAWWAWALGGLGLLIVLGGLAVIAGKAGDNRAATQTAAARRSSTATPGLVITKAPAVLGAIGKVCLAFNGSVNDLSFNQSTWQAAQTAVSWYNGQAMYLEAPEAADIAKNVDQLAADNCDLIVSVGYQFADATRAAAQANPQLKFQILDIAYDQPLDNVWAQVYATDQGAFLAGYVAAAATRTSKVGTFGGLQIPVVEDFMDGFALGVQAYNQKYGTQVQVLGWDVKTRKGLFAGSFTDPQAGARLANQLLQDGADIIFPVAGGTGESGGGAADAVLAHGNAYLIGVNTDWYVSAPQYAPIMLTSVVKRVDLSVTAAIQAAAKGSFQGGTYMGTLASRDVDLAPFHNLDRLVAANVKSDLIQLKADIIAGRIQTK